MSGHHQRGVSPGTGRTPRRYSHRDVHFPGLAAAAFPAAPAAPRNGTIAMTDLLTVDYKGTEPFPGGSDAPPRTFEGGGRVAVTAAIVLVPFGGLAVAVWLAWGHGLNLTDVLLAVAFYLVTGLGVTVGFHRLLTHRSFTAAPALRAALAIAGSMAFEGQVTGWVAIHRRHHAFADRPGDPHSPYRTAPTLPGRFRGL